MADKRKEPRTPITLKIKFKSGSIDQFVERYSVDVSQGGIFIRTKDPLPVGTKLRFEFQLQDASSLITGEGSVVWARKPESSHSGVAAPGMGVRFDKLTGPSQQVLERIMNEKKIRGGDVLESRYEAGIRAQQSGATTTDNKDKSAPLPKPAPSVAASVAAEAAPPAAAVEKITPAAKPEEKSATTPSSDEKLPKESAKTAPAKNAAALAKKTPDKPVKKTPDQPAAAEKKSSSMMTYIIVLIVLAGIIGIYFAFSGSAK